MSSLSSLKTVSNLQTQNYLNLIRVMEDNITYYKCDVSKWEEVERVAKQIVAEVTPTCYLLEMRI